MPQQVVDLAVINRALGLHQYTPLVSTIAQITHLVSFREQHEPCANLIFTLRDELAQIKASLLQQNSQYLNKRIEMARQQSQKLFKAESMAGSLVDTRKKEYIRFQSLQQFMRREYDIKVKRNVQKNSSMKLTHCVSQYFLPIEQILQRQRIREEKQRLRGEGGIILGDFV